MLNNTVWEILLKNDSVSLTIKKNGEGERDTYGFKQLKIYVKQVSCSDRKTLMIKKDYKSICEI